MNPQQKAKLATLLPGPTNKEARALVREALRSQYPADALDSLCRRIAFSHPEAIRSLATLVEEVSR